MPHGCMGIVRIEQLSSTHSLPPNGTAFAKNNQAACIASLACDGALTASLKIKMPSEERTRGYGYFAEI